ncbi:MAG: twin-arginine translocase subunit TatC [Candidatus Omnitrophota bacterium]
MESKDLTFTGHLDELRRRIIISLAAVAVCSCLAFWKIQDILSFLMIPPVDHLVFFSPVEAFMEYCKLAFFTGLIVASPVVLFQLWSFVSPGLTGRERGAFLAAMPFSATLFIGGAAFAFFAVLPWALKFLINFPGPEVVPVISISKYLSFVIMLLLVFGIVFELPVAVFLLSKLGIITPLVLSRNRKYAILAIFVLAAVLTPTPDAFTQVMMAVPLIILYEISIWICRFTYKKEQ